MGLRSKLPSNTANGKLRVFRRKNGKANGVIKVVDDSGKEGNLSEEPLLSHTERDSASIVDESSGRPPNNRRFGLEISAQERAPPVKGDHVTDQNRTVEADGSLYQDISLPGATRMEVNCIWRTKLLAEQKKRLLQIPTVQKALGIIWAVVAVWFIANIVLSAIPSQGREVASFLQKVNLKQYSSTFKEKGYIYLSDLLLATDEDLRDYVGIDVVPHRRRILGYAEIVKNQKPLLSTILRGMFLGLCVLLALLMIGLAVWSEVRKRVVVAVMFWGFMLWYRLRLYHRLWNCLDVNRKPKVSPVIVEAPTVIEHDFNFREALMRLASGTPEPGSSPIDCADVATVDGEGPENGARHRQNQAFQST